MFLQTDDLTYRAPSGQLAELIQAIKHWTVLAHVDWKQKCRELNKVKVTYFLKSQLKPILDLLLHHEHTNSTMSILYCIKRIQFLD